MRSPNLGPPFVPYCVEPAAVQPSGGLPVATLSISIPSRSPPSASVNLAPPLTASVPVGQVTDCEVKESTEAGLDELTT
jgi:hypothetical protein